MKRTYIITREWKEKLQEHITILRKKDRQKLKQATKKREIEATEVKQIGRPHVSTKRKPIQYSTYTDHDRPTKSTRGRVNDWKAYGVKGDSYGYTAKSLSLTQTKRHKNLKKGNEIKNFWLRSKSKTLMKI
jgi:hypothetical protein